MDPEAPSAPRDDLIRMSEHIELREDGEGRTLHGYMAVFDTPTEINSWEGTFEETIAPGAFRKTLRESRDNIVPLFNHGFDPSIGDKPLGRFSVLKEDRTGVYYEVPLSDTSYNADIAALVRDGAIPGNSFRFSVVKDEWEKPARKGGMAKRRITELRLMEGGPVTFPAYQATTVGIRSREHFAAWRAADEDKRSEIARILGISIDLRTSADGAGSTTPLAGAAAIADKPVVDHLARFTQLKARARLLIPRS